MLPLTAEFSETWAYDGLFPADQGVLDLVTLLQGTARFLWKDWPMDMEIASISPDLNRFTLRGTCPHCGVTAAFPAVVNTFEEKASIYELRLLAPARCIACNEFILAIIKNVRVLGGEYTGWVYGVHYPLGKPDDKVSPQIPDGIREDYQEAIRCLWVNAYNATAEMCRRALESACLKLGAPKDKVLQKMIDHLAEHQKITPYLQQAAHKIRLGGDRGAHPPEDIHEKEQTPKKGDDDEGPVERLGPEHAEFILKYTGEFFHHIFVGPALLDSHDFSKKKAAKS